jgi:hypothetical protein
MISAWSVRSGRIAADRAVCPAGRELVFASDLKATRRRFDNNVQRHALGWFAELLIGALLLGGRVS